MEKIIDWLERNPGKLYLIGWVVLVLHAALAGWTYSMQSYPLTAVNVTMVVMMAIILLRFRF